MRQISSGRGLNDARLTGAFCVMPVRLPPKRRGPLTFFGPFERADSSPPSLFPCPSVSTSKPRVGPPSPDVAEEGPDSWGSVSRLPSSAWSSSGVPSASGISGRSGSLAPCPPGEVERGLSSSRLRPPDAPAPSRVDSSSADEAGEDDSPLSGGSSGGGPGGDPEEARSGMVAPARGSAASSGLWLPFWSASCVSSSSSVSEALRLPAPWPTSAPVVGGAELWLLRSRPPEVPAPSAGEPLEGGERRRTTAVLIGDAGVLGRPIRRHIHFQPLLNSLNTTRELYGMTGLVLGQTRKPGLCWLVSLREPPSVGLAGRRAHSRIAYPRAAFVRTARSNHPSDSSLRPSAGRRS